MQIPPDALGPTPDGTAVVHLGLAGPPGKPGSSWNPASYPAETGNAPDARQLHVRFAELELTAAP